MHPAITGQIISDMQDRRLRRAAERARASGLRSGLFAALRARLTARRTARLAQASALATIHPTPAKPARPISTHFIADTTPVTGGTR